MHQRGALLSFLTALGWKYWLTMQFCTYIYNRSFSSFRLLEKPHQNIFPCKNLSTITWEIHWFFHWRFWAHLQQKIHPWGFSVTKLGRVLEIPFSTNFFMMSISMNKNQHDDTCKIKKKIPHWNCKWNRHCTSSLLKQVAIWWM